MTGIVFRAEQAGYLVGYAAGLWAKLHPVDGRSVVGSVGSLSIPPVDSYLAGFRFGARRADPDVTVLNDYTQDALDQAKCRRSAREEIAKGASVIFEVAGPCGRVSSAWPAHRACWRSAPRPLRPRPRRG